MRKLLSICAFCAVLFIIVAMPRPASASELEVSGFFDVICTYQSSADDGAEFGLGQTEVDIENELSDKVSVAVAIAFNADESMFELGAAELGMNLYSNEETFVSSFNVVAGQFDIPFGIDYHCYPSIDRKLVTPPAAVGLTHDGWNDFGVRFEAEHQHGNFVAYWVNGFEYPVIADADNLATLVEKWEFAGVIGEEAWVSPMNTFGTRLGFTPMPGLELGGSFAMAINDSDIDRLNLYGGDAQFSVSDLKLKGEYIVRSVDVNEITGYYIQSTYNINPAFLVARYGSWSFGDEWTPRISVGAGYSIWGAAEVRLETAIEDNSDDNLTLLQFVAGF